MLILSRYLWGFPLLMPIQTSLAEAPNSQQAPRCSKVCLEQSGDSSTTQLPSGHSPAVPYRKKPRLLCLAFLVCRIQPLPPAPPLFSLSHGLALSSTFCFLLTGSPIGHPRRNTRQCSSHQCRFHLPNLTNSSPMQNLASIPFFSTWNQKQAHPNSCSHRQSAGRWDQRPLRDFRSAT